MAKPTIVTRAGKGSEVSWVEGDANFTNLQNATISLIGGTAGTEVQTDLNGAITVVAGNNISVTGNNTTKTITVSATGLITIDDASTTSTTATWSASYLSTTLGDIDAALAAIQGV
jgi:hypothetical protein